MVLKRALFWSITTQVFGAAANFVSSVAISRLLNPYEIGVIALSISILVIMNTFFSFSLSSFITKENFIDDEIVSTACTINAIMSLLLSGILIVIAAFNSYYLQQNDVCMVLMVLTILPIVNIADFRPRAMLQRNIDYRTLAVSDIAKNSINVVLSIAFAYLNYSYMSIAYANVVSSIVSCALLNVLAPEHVSYRLSMVSWRRIVIFGIRMLTIGGLATLSARLSDIFLGYYLGIAALGLYSRATAISSLLFNNLYGSITRVLFSQLAAEQRSSGSLGPSFLRSFQIITAIFWPLLGGIGVLAGPAIRILYGEEWIACSMPLTILMIAQIIVLCFGMNWELFVLRDQLGLQTKFESVRAIFGFSVFAAGCTLGIGGAALGRVIEASFGLFLYLPHMKRMVGATTETLLRIYRDGILLTLAAISPSVFLMYLYSWSPNVRLELIIVAVIAGIIAWLSLLRVLNHPLYIEMGRALTSRAHLEKWSR